MLGERIQPSRRNLKRKKTPPTEPLIVSDRPTLRLRQLTRDGQPEPRRPRVRRRTIGPIKGFKYPLALGNRDPRPAIRDLKAERAVRLRHRDRDGPIAGAAQRVVHEIRHYTERLYEIESAKQRGLGIIDDRLDAFRLGHSRELPYRRAEQILSGVDLRVHREGAGLETRQIEHVRHHL